MFRLGVCTLLVTIFIAGCSTTSEPLYDHNAIKKKGVVKSKEEILSTDKFESESMILAPFVVINIGSPQKEGSSYVYQVSTTDGVDIKVINKFGGFEIGECVNLFLSKIDPAKIAYGSGCE